MAKKSSEQERPQSWAFSKEDRHTGRERTIYVHGSNHAHMGRWIRSIVIRRPSRQVENENREAA